MLRLRNAVGITPTSDALPNGLVALRHSATPSQGTAAAAYPAAAGTTVTTSYDEQVAGPYDCVILDMRATGLLRALTICDDREAQRLVFLGWVGLERERGRAFRACGS
jgi:hypothetical protein